MGTLVKEHGYQGLAFEDYYSLRSSGKKRRIIMAELARKYHKSVHTVEGWYRGFNWPKRATERDFTLRSKVAERVEETIQGVVATQRNIVKATLARYVEALRANKIHVDADTMRRLLEHQLVLHGYNPYRPQVNIFQNNVNGILDKVGFTSDASKAKVLDILEAEFSELAVTGEKPGGEK